VDKKLAAHLRAAGAEPKARRISNKSAGTEYGISSNGWTDMSKHMRLELVKLDQKLQGLVAMCAMATALNKKAILQSSERQTRYGGFTCTKVMLTERTGISSPAQRRSGKAAFT
jgi:hypothetical protein